MKTQYYTVNIDSSKVRSDIQKKMSLTDMAVILKPNAFTRENAYHGFKYWLKVGRMPKAEYKKMMGILNGMG